MLIVVKQKKRCSISYQQKIWRLQRMSLHQIILTNHFRITPTYSIHSNINFCKISKYVFKSHEISQIFLTITKIPWTMVIIKLMM